MDFKIQTQTHTHKRDTFNEVLIYHIFWFVCLNVVDVTNKMYHFHLQELNRARKSLKRAKKNQKEGYREK